MFCFTMLTFCYLYVDWYWQQFILEVAKGHIWTSEINRIELRFQYLQLLVKRTIFRSIFRDGKTRSNTFEVRILGKQVRTNFKTNFGKLSIKTVDACIYKNKFDVTTFDLGSRYWGTRLGYGKGNQIGLDTALKEITWGRQAGTKSGPQLWIWPAKPKFSCIQLVCLIKKIELCTLES